MAKEATRDAFGRAIIKLAEEHNNVFTMDCDLGRSTKAHAITQVDPSRFIEMGISEQDMVSTAAGMAAMGNVVFVNSFAVFVTGRAYDQIRQQAALARLNVKICGSSAGLTQGPDGATHQSVADINLMRGLPNMQVFCPSDGRQTEEIIQYAYDHEGPMYIRLSRYETESLIPEGVLFEPGKGQEIRQGKDLALLSCGPILSQVLKAGDILAEKGISCGIYNFPTLKPFDQVLAEKIARNFSLVFTVEEHSVIGGLGSAAAEVFSAMTRENCRARLIRLGVQDCFGESGSADELLARHQLDGEGIVRQVKGFFQE